MTQQQQHNFINEFNMSETFSTSWITIFILLFHTCDLTLSFLDIDELKQLKYGMEITKKPVILSHLSQQNVLHLSSKYGQMYQCLLPIKEIKNPNSEDDLLQENNITVNSILDAALEGQCFLYNLGWWTYKVCYKKEITQYHEDNGVIPGNIISLGAFESEKLWNSTNNTKNSDREEYHSHNYTNGTVCELVGKKRETTIKFVCSGATSNSVIAVDETETCLYTITVSCKELCEHPLFKPKSMENVKEITCSPAISKDQYDEYIKQEQEESLKKKKAEEEKLAKLQDKGKEKGAKVVMDALDGLISGFSSFVTKPFPSKSSKEEKKESSEKDLSSFWKDFGFSPEGPAKPVDGSKKFSMGERHETGPGEGLDASGKDQEEPMSDNTMSKGDNMLSSEGQPIGKDAKTSSKSGASKINENVQRLISLQDTIDQIDKQAEALIRKDREKRKIFIEQFSKSKRKVEKQIIEFRKLMTNLKSRKSKEKDDKKVARLEKLIRRVNENIRKYNLKLSVLEGKVKKSLQRSKAFEKQYKDITNLYPSKSLSKKTGIGGAETIKSLNEVINELNREKQAEETENSAKSEERLDASSSEQGEAKEMKNLDPLLETVMKMLKLGGKKQKKASEPTMTEEDGANTKEPLTSDKESSHLNEQEQAKASTVEELEEPQEDPADKIKVRVSRLGEDERKILEENEKQEELSGPNKANNRLKKAGKKIEDLIKKKLKKAGVDLGAKIKIKIITNDGPLASMNSDSKTDILSDETAAQFKDLLTNMLGGGAEKVKEERRQSALEESYKFVWKEKDEKANKEQNDIEDDDRVTFP